MPLKKGKGEEMIVFQASPIRKWVGGTSSNADLASLKTVLTSLYLAGWGSSTYPAHWSLSSLPSFITFREYCLELLTSTLGLLPFHVRGVNFLGGSSFMLEIAQSFHLLLLDLWSWRSCLAHGILQCAERMWSFVSQWNMSGFFLFFFQQLSYAPHPVWSSLNWIYI